MNDNKTKNALREALKAVTELQSDDHIHAPQTPTIQMLKAGCDAINTNISDIEAHNIYCAMLSAIE